MKRRKSGENMIQVTIIIPNYNGHAFLKDCLEAIFAQENCPACQVLVVDNGSVDESRELLSTYFPQVRVIALPSNTGFCHAVNVGIQAAETPYVILLNNDTKVFPWFVRALYDAIEARQEAFSVSAQMVMWDDPKLLDDAGDRYCVLGWAYARGKGKPAAAYDRPAEVFSACGGAAIYRRDILKKIGLFDEGHFAYLEDLDIGWRARIYGYRNFYEPAAGVIHYGSATSGARYNEWKTGLAAANSVYVIAKNMPLFQWILNLPFLMAGFFVKFLFFCKKGMGRQYLGGLREGFTKAWSPAGKARKVKFRRRNLKHYFALQWQFYMNTLRILKKS